MMQQVSVIIFVLCISVTSSSAAPSYSSSSKSSTSASSDLTKKIIKSLAKAVVFSGRESGTKHLRGPMRPVEPLPSNSADIITPIINLVNNVRDMEHNLKKRTYSYGLMVVGRPLEELTMTQKLVRAALMPGKYYEDATSAIANQLNKFVINKPGRDIHRKSKSKRQGAGTAKSLDWGDVILRLITLAASSIPTPVVKHWTRKA